MTRSVTPQVLAGGRRGFVLRAGGSSAPRLWTIEPQVQINTRFHGLPKKRIDFLLTPVNRAGTNPIVIEMDGLEYHASTVAQDLLDRVTMIRSGKVRVWTLSWRDLDPKDQIVLNPLAEQNLGATKIGLLSRVLANESFSALAGAVRKIQTDTSLASLRRLLDGDTEESVSARSVLVRALVANGQPLEQLPKSDLLSEEGRLFLLTPGLTEHVGVGAIDLYLACKRISPTSWGDSDQDVRLLLRAFLPAPGEAPAAKAIYTEAWRGLWRLVNLFQEVRGFHVELEGLDTLSPPDLSQPADASDGVPDAWIEARSLCDEAFHPLIDALIAAQTPSPDRFGDDLFSGKRVVGMMEFGWSEKTIAVAREIHEGVGWSLIRFDPETDTVGATVTKILQALEGAQS